MCAKSRAAGAPWNGARPGQRLEGQAAERVDVGASIGRLAEDLARAPRSRPCPPTARSASAASDAASRVSPKSVR
jgi:hypothetical protein